MPTRHGQMAFAIVSAADEVTYLMNERESRRKTLVDRIKSLQLYSVKSAVSSTTETVLGAELRLMDGRGQKRPHRHTHMRPTHEFPTKDKDMGVYSIQEHPTIVDRLREFFTERH